jgi:asparagine synthetase B (glutamine-hydrolysing)
LTSAVSSPVADFIWQGDEFAPSIHWAAAADPVSVLAGLAGQFSLHVETVPGRHLLARDRLGVNKLFFSMTDDGRVVSSNYWVDLVRQGCPSSAIWSVPAGRLLRIAPGHRSLSLDRFAGLSFGGSERPIEAHAREIRARLDETFRRMRPAVDGRSLYVTLSGGLDSTTIAVLAREWLGHFTAVTFVVDDGTGPVESDDLRFARQVAADLAIPLKVVVATPDELVAFADTALLYGQDWRDFNVHCGVVNAAIARAISVDHGERQDRPLLLTGDCMNELMADYSPVSYAGGEYYTLPRLGAGRLRRFLVQGLDAGDREIGIFAREGLEAIQPYALCADAFAALPDEWLAEPEAKQRLARSSVGDLVPSYVLNRRKVRAQIGGEQSSGVLGVFVSRGLDSRWLQARFAHLFSLEPSLMSSMIRAGVYRFPTAFQALEAE